MRKAGLERQKEMDDRDINLGILWVKQSIWKT